MKESKLGAYLALIARSLIYGMSFYFTGSLLKSADVFEVLALRFLLSAIVFSLLVLFKVVKVNYKGKRLLPLVYVMIFEPIGCFIFETLGLVGTTTSVAGLLNSLGPALVIIFEMIILRETTTKGQKILVALRIMGGLIIVTNAGSTQSNTFMGVIFIILSVFAGVFFFIFSRKASKDFTAMEITYAMTMVGAVVFNTINIIRHLSANTMSSYFEPLLNRENIIGFVFLSIFCSIFATFFNNYSLGKLQASFVSAFGGLSTVVTVVAGAWLNKEVLFWYHYVSVTLVIISSFALVYVEEKKR